MSLIKKGVAMHIKGQIEPNLTLIVSPVLLTLLSSQTKKKFKKFKM